MKKFIVVMAFLTFGIVVTIVGIAIAGNSLMTTEVLRDQQGKKVTPFPVTDQELPENLKWENGLDQPMLGSERAVKGGVFYTSFTSYPTTFRVVGPDSNSSFRSYILDNNMPLIQMHPETNKFIPGIAKEWAKDEDGRTVYFKLDPEAKWSNGVPVTADDFIYTWRFMCTPGIVAPWYNEYYSTNYEELIKYDSHTLAIRLKNPLADILYSVTMSPTPHHYYGDFRLVDKEISVSKAILAYKRMNKKIPNEFLSIQEEYKKRLESNPKAKEPKVKATIEDVEENWVKKYNWEVVPNTGPYQITSFTKSKDVTLGRNKNWWAKDKKYNKYRYNVDFYKFKIIRDSNSAFERWKKHEIDTFRLQLPEYWHNKAKYLDIVEKGYANKIWFFNDTPQPCYLMTFNISSPPLDDINLRTALAHSLDINKMLKTVMKDDYVRSETFHEGYGEYSHPSLKARRYDLKKAEEYFKKAGWGNKDSDGVRIKNGKRLELTILYYGEHNTPRLLVIKEGALKAGVDFKLESYDGNSVFMAMLDKKHQVGWHGWGPRFRPQYWGLWHKDNANKKKNNNFSNLSDDKVSEMINQFRQAKDSKTRISLAHKIEERLYDLVPAVPLYKAPYLRQGYWRWIKFPEGYGVRNTSEYMTDYGMFWIDQEEKKKILEAMKKRETIYGTEKVIIEKRYLKGAE